MKYFLNTYYERKQEIDRFIDLLEFLQKKESNVIENSSEFERFFHSKEEAIELTYQELINILKSNVSLMIYNIIEFTVTNLVESIYDELEAKEITYLDANDEIRNLWRKTYIKTMNDPSSNLNTFLNKNKQIIDFILDNNTITMESKSTLPSGNLDGPTIIQTFKEHGLLIGTDSSNYRPDILGSIKKNRNDLAHGTVSFVEAVRNDSISDIRDNKNTIINFLEELIDIVLSYIDAQNYRESK